MVNREFKSFNDIIEYVNTITAKEWELECELENLKCNIFDKDYKLKKSKQKRINDKLDYIEDTRDYLTDVVMNYATFDRDIFIRFMVKFLELMKGKPYADVGNIASCGGKIIPHKLKGFISPIKSILKEFDLLTSLEDADFIKENTTSSLYDDEVEIEDILDFIDEKYICLDKSKKYCLLDGLTLAEDFEKYPYLLTVAILLVNIKIKCPQASDEQRLDYVYNKIKQKVEERKNKGL